MTTNEANEMPAIAGGFVCVVLLILLTFAKSFLVEAIVKGQHEAEHEQEKRGNNTTANQSLESDA